MESLETTTESLCDQLKKFVAEQMEEKRSRKADQEQAARVFGYIGLGILLIVVLVVLKFLFYYLCLWLKSKLSGRITRTPKTPIDESKLNRYTFRNEKLRDVKLLHATYEYAYSIRSNKKLFTVLKMVFDLRPRQTYDFPTETRTLSIPMEGFKCGANCHDFKPIDGEVSGSYYTYQMYGDTIQVTRYVVGSQSFVAGFCVYLKNNDVWDVEINEKVIERLMKLAKYPGKEAVEMAQKSEKIKSDEKVSVFSRVLGFFKSKGTGKSTETDSPPTYSSLSMA